MLPYLPPTQPGRLVRSRALTSADATIAAVIVVDLIKQTRLHDRDDESPSHRSVRPFMR